MAELTPAEILRIYGVDVTTLALGTTYKIATDEDMWLSASGAPTIAVGDLIITSPDSYSSRIYAHKVTSRPFMAMPESGDVNKYIYVYHKIFAIGTIRGIVDNVFKMWAENKTTFGRMSFVVDHNKEQVIIIVDYNTTDVNEHPLAAVKRIKVNSSTLRLQKLETVIKIYGNLMVVQNYKCDDNGITYYAYVGMD